MTRAVLVEASPWAPATGTVTAVRLAGGGRLHYRHKGFNDWLAGVAALPKVTTEIGFDDDGFTGGAIPQAAAIGFMPSRPDTLATLGRLLWKGAAVTISSGDDEAAVPAWTVDLAGSIAGYSTTAGAFSFTLSDMGAALAKPVTSATFAGTGGLEGIAEAKGRSKRRSWGKVFDVEGRVLNKAANIYEFNDPAFPLQAFTEVRDRGRAGALTVVAAGATPAATLAALIATATPAGGAAVAPSIGCVKWWTTPSGPLAADLTGEAAAGNSVPQIASALSAAVGGPAVTGLAALVAARGDDAGLHIGNNSETVAAALDRLLIGASMAWSVAPSGGLLVQPLAFADPVETITALGDIERDAVFAPVISAAVGYQRNERVHTDGEISAAVQAGDVVLPSGASVDAAISAIVSDSVLGRGEKPRAVLDRDALLADRDALQARYIALGSPADIQAARDNGFAKMTALDTYLGGLAPSWSDASQDTAIVAADYRSAWADAYSAIAAFAAAVTGRQGAQGIAGTPGADGITFYTWVAFANSADGSVDFTTGAPGTRRYRGEAINQAIATESTNPADYSWSLYTGPAAFGLAGVNASIGANSAAKSGGTAGTYDGGVYSTEGWRSGCALSFRPAALAIMAIGINSDPTTDTLATSIDYAFDLVSVGSAMRFRESGALVTPGLTYAVGDVLQITYDGAKVRYFQNGLVVREVAALAAQLFYFDAAFAAAASAITAIGWGPMGSIGPTTFTLGGTTAAMSIGANFASKTGASGAWDAQVYSNEPLRSGALASARPGATTGGMMFGINTDPLTDADYVSIDYAFQFAGSGALNLREAGAIVASGLTYAAGDVMQIRYDNQFVRYYRNGALLREVAAAADLAFYFDSSFNSQGARIYDIGWSAPGAAGVSPVTVSAQPETVQIGADASGAPASGALPVTITNNATKGGAGIAITAVAIVSSNGCTAAVSGTGIEISAISATSGSVVYNVTADGQTVKKTVTFVTTAAGGTGGGASASIKGTAAVTSSTYAQNGSSITLAAPSSGKISVNLTGSYKAGTGDITLQTKIQYRVAAGTFADVSGSQAIGTDAYYSGEPGAPSFAIAGGVNGTGPYVLTGLTSGASYEFRTMARIYDGTVASTSAVNLTLYAEQAT